VRVLAGLVERILDARIARLPTRRPPSLRGVVANGPALDLEDEQPAFRVRDNEVRLALLRSAFSGDDPRDMVKRDEVVTRVVTKPLEDALLSSACVLGRRFGDHSCHRCLAS
jgi:hypothetical protein